MQCALRLDHVAQHAVDAKAHHRAGFIGFDMDVRGILAQGLGQQRVDQADDRRIIFGFQQIADFRQFLGQLPQVKILLHVVHQARGVVIRARINLGQALLEFCRLK